MTTTRAVDAHAHVFCGDSYPYRDVDHFIAAAIAAFTLENCVWGSDWPFVRLDERMDYGSGPGVFAALAAGCRGPAESAVGHAGAVVRFQVTKPG